MLLLSLINIPVRIRSAPKAPALTLVRELLTTTNPVSAERRPLLKRIFLKQVFGNSSHLRMISILK
ncbi:hypothetical protein J2X84_003803 [Pseudomonas corrugata]|jgi:hypothetical protein|nr:hypothetical protein [Pseudomonas corrugata]